MANTAVLLFISYKNLTDIAASGNPHRLLPASELDQKSGFAYTHLSTMKKGIHPEDYRPVVIKDSNSGFAFLTRATGKFEDTIEWEDGNVYPLLTVHISSASHPFYTGEEKIVDVEGRVDRFKARTAAAQERRSKLAQKAAKSQKKSDKPAATKLGANPNKTSAPAKKS